MRTRSADTEARHGSSLLGAPFGQGPGPAQELSGAFWGAKGGNISIVQERLCLFFFWADVCFR